MRDRSEGGQMTEKQTVILLGMAENLGQMLDRINGLLLEKQGATHADLELIAVQMVGIAMQTAQVIGLQMEGDK